MTEGHVNVHFNHVGITVSDLDRALAFYSAIFGLSPGMVFHITQGPDKAKALGLPEHRQRVALVPVDDVVLELIEITPHRRENDSRQDDIGYTYISFEVDDLDEVYERLRDRGIEFNAEPLASSNEPPAAGSKFCIMKDPDGKNIELMQIGPGLRTSAIHDETRNPRWTLESPRLMGH
jgi:catechol 2,3-dioxygenase-like lactoylglutathione lyase family enzyme